MSDSNPCIGTCASNANKHPGQPEMASKWKRRTKAEIEEEKKNREEKKELKKKKEEEGFNHIVALEDKMDTDDMVTKQPTWRPLPRKTNNKTKVILTSIDMEDKSITECKSTLPALSLQDQEYQPSDDKLGSSPDSDVDLELEGPTKKIPKVTATQRIEAAYQKLKEPTQEVSKIPLLSEYQLIIYWFYLDVKSCDLPVHIVGIKKLPKG